MIWNIVPSELKDMTTRSVFNPIQDKVNDGHKIMKHLKILVQVPFATTKVVLDTEYKEHCLRATSQLT